MMEGKLEEDPHGLTSKFKGFTLYRRSCPHRHRAFSRTEHMQHLSTHITAPSDLLLVFCSEMILQCVGKNFAITALDDPAAPSLMINRVSGTVSIGARVAPPEQEGARPVLQLYGILGFVELLAGRYLVVITEREFVGKVRGQAVYKVMRTNILSFAPDLSHVPPSLRENEKRYISMLQAVLQCPFHYFSYSYDLTQSVQRTAGLSKEGRSLPMWLRADERFFWNHSMVQPLLEQEVCRCLLCTVAHC